MIKKILIYGAGFLALLILADAVLVWGIAHNQTKISDIEKADAVIVFGAAINTPALRNRTLEGLEIYEEGKAERMILSGGKISESDISEAEFMEKMIKNYANAEVDYILEEQSHNTYENLKNSKKALEEVDPEASSVILVSDSFHLARAVLLAKRMGFETVYWNSPSSGYYQRPELRFYYIREFVAIFKYIPKFIFG